MFPELGFGEMEDDTGDLASGCRGSRAVRTKVKFLGTGDCRMGLVK